MRPRSWRLSFLGSIWVTYSKEVLSKRLHIYKCISLNYGLPICSSFSLQMRKKKKKLICNGVIKRENISNLRAALCCVVHAIHTTGREKLLSPCVKNGPSEQPVSDLAGLVENSYEAARRRSSSLGQDTFFVILPRRGHQPLGLLFKASSLVMISGLFKASSLSWFLDYSNSSGTQYYESNYDHYKLFSFQLCYWWNKEGLWWIILVRR